MKKLQKRDFSKVGEDDLQDLKDAYEEMIDLEESGEAVTTQEEEELIADYWSVLQQYYENPEVLNISFDDYGCPKASNFDDDSDFVLAIQDIDPDDFGYVPYLER